MEKPLAAFWMGFSGSGKDTQAMLLKKVLEARDGEGSVLVSSAGDTFRRIAEAGTYAGRVVKTKVLDPGNAAPPFAATWAWANIIMQELREGQHIIFPSSPRFSQEAHDLDDFADLFELRAFPIFIDVAYDEAFKRLKARGRADDTDAVIKNRLNFFDKVVRPSVEYFRTESKNHLITIDGNSHDEQEIHQSVLKALHLT